MSYTISHPGRTISYQEARPKTSIFSKMIKWAERQDKINHVSWVGISVMVMAGVLFPVTMTVVLLNGAAFSLIMTSMVALVLVVVSNLAALPTKYTIPFLLLGTLIDLGAIVCSFFIQA
ncbi:MAG TPA: hypothetical protein VFV08_11945 [Puia sp.]|nr:hypothetical protein [Puia sp.]